MKLSRFFVTSARCLDTVGERKAAGAEQQHDFPAFLGPRVLFSKMGTVALGHWSGLQSHGRVQGPEAD